MQSESSFDDVRWSTLELSEFTELYKDEIEPERIAQGFEPDDRPSHEWFREHGLRPFLSALRRHHDYSFGAFWTELLAYGTENGYDWATEDDATIDALESFLDSRRDRHDLAESSIDAKRRRLNLYVRAYVAANGDDDLLSPVARESDVRPYRAVDACYAAFDHLNEQAYAPRTKRRVRGVVDEWYGHLVGRRRAGVNPAQGLYSEFRWSVSDPDPPSLSAAHVRALMDAATDDRDRVLVVALAAWGLRANEVASLHVDQLVRPSDAESVPYLHFEERKNGPGEVSVLFGLDEFEARVATLSEDDEWSGYLFPSAQGTAPHVTRGRIWAWFRELAAEAAVPESIDGARPSPQLARRFWYDAYTAVLGPVLEMVGEVAAEQGSSDPQVVVENYLQDERARRLRRTFMREQLEAAFACTTGE
jgi:site-specific recombinase XerD